MLDIIISAPLSPMEMTVYNLLISSPLSYTALANQLHIAPSTLRTHVAAVYKKMGISYLTTDYNQRMLLLHLAQAGKVPTVHR